jgi:hypothetical protein
LIHIPYWYECEGRNERKEGGTRHGRWRDDGRMMGGAMEQGRRREEGGTREEQRGHEPGR